MGDGPTVVDDEIPNPRPLDRGEQSISVGHTGLLIDGEGTRQLHSRPDDYGSFSRTHQGNLSGPHFGCFGVSEAT